MLSVCNEYFSISIRSVYIRKQPGTSYSTFVNKSCKYSYYCLEEVRMFETLYFILLEMIHCMLIETQNYNDYSRMKYPTDLVVQRI